MVLYTLPLYSLICLGAALANPACPRGPETVPVEELATTEPFQSALASLDAFLSDTVANSSVPGVVVSVVYNQQVVLTKGYGLRNYTAGAAGPSPDGQTFTRVASITKVFTDLLLYSARDAGQLGLDDPVEKHLGGGFSVRSPYASGRPLTLRELASHTSGLQRENPSRARQQLMQRV